MPLVDLVKANINESTLRSPTGTGQGAGYKMPFVTISLSKIVKDEVQNKISPKVGASE